MKYIIKTVFILLLLLLPVTPVLAHGGEEGEVDAPTLVKQAIAFLEGTGDTGAANLRILEAMEEDDETLNATKLKEAQQALNSGDITGAKRALVMALGNDPDYAEELSFHPEFSGGAAGYGAAIFSGLLILLGLGFLFKVRTSERQV